MKIKYIALCSLLLINSVSMATWMDQLDMTVEAAAPVLPPPVTLATKAALWMWKAYVYAPKTYKVITFTGKAVGTVLATKAVEKTANTIIDVATPASMSDKKEPVLTAEQKEKLKVIAQEIAKTNK
jgi:hypothetical protein